MIMKQYLRILAIVIAGYIVLALIWWSVLLIQKNESLYQADLRLREFYDLYPVPGSQGFPDTEQLLAKYKRQRLMIIGESLFILISISIGIWLIFRSYVQEQRVFRQQRNFLLSITHELKTPLTAMRLAFETIQKRTLTREQLERLVQSSIRESDRLSNTVNHLLLAARLEKKYMAQPQPRLLKNVITQWQQEWKNHWPDRALDLRLDANPEQEILADWPGLDIIFRNLTDNAAMYSPSDQPVVASLSTSGTWLRLEVSDTGPGIPVAERSRIFDMFYRIGNEETRASQGTGLGLYLVREIVRQNHGQIRLMENIPNGTCFHIQLPI
mgnify:CR=1 FL=1